MTRRGLCTPVGSLVAWPARLGRCCCGETVRLVRTAETVNDWAEETLDGVRYVDRAPALLRADPEAFWAQLAQQDVATYSRLRAAVELGHHSWFHHHRAETWEPGPADREPPFCHGRPMWASPDGWQCREMRVLFRYQEAP